MTVRAFLVLPWLILALPAASAESPEPSATLPGRRVQIDPDYADLIIPPNVAPLNFKILGAPVPWRVRLRGTAGGAIEVESHAQGVQIPLKSWRTLLEANRGQSIHLEFHRPDPEGKWLLWDTLTNGVAREDIDGWLVYRLIRPLYTRYVDVGIYQRDLSTFEETVVLHNRSFDQGCVNCHTFLNQEPERMALHVRTRTNGLPMLLARPDGVTRVEETAGYLSWHPNGRWLAFSMNKLSLFFHSTGETRDVYDANSDVGVYDLEGNVVIMPTPLAQPDQMETWPAWSPDGRSLYFCSAPRKPVEAFREIFYDLKRIAFDPATGIWGPVETLVNAQALRRSIAQPRPSPDGRLLLFCLLDYGHFPIYHPDSDLQVIDLSAGGNVSRRLEINSPQADTWHCWSSTSRWLVFSSKRRDGLFARPHLSYVDAQGRFHKPFLLPQKDPGFYDACLKTFNLPELIIRPIPYSEQDFATAIKAPHRVLRPKANEPQALEVSEGVLPEVQARRGLSPEPE